MKLKGAFIRRLSTQPNIALYRFRTAQGAMIDAAVEGKHHPRILRGLEREITGHYLDTDFGRKFIVENIEM